jgi:hypothetical protein
MKFQIIYIFTNNQVNLSINNQFSITNLIYWLIRYTIFVKEAFHYVQLYEC